MVLDILTFPNFCCNNDTNMKPKELLDYEHELHLKEIKTRLEAEKELENLRFDHQLQLQRIRSAEIQKNIMRKGF